MVIADDTSDTPTQFSVEATAIRLFAVNSSRNDVSTLTIASGEITDSSGSISFDNENLHTTGTLGCGVLTAGTGSTVGNLTLANGSITDSSGAITFGNENLTTTGTLGCGVLTAATGSTVGNLTLANGSITDSSGAISFGDENLSTTGTMGCGVLTAATGTTVGNLTLANGSITDSSGTISFGDENLTTTGDVTAGAVIANSDRRLKQNIEYTNASDALQQVLHMKPVTYQFKATPNVQRQGVIAQDLQQVAPHLVTVVHEGTDKERLAVNYLDMVSSLVGAVQALHTEMTDLKRQLSS